MVVGRIRSRVAFSMARLCRRGRGLSSPPQRRRTDQPARACRGVMTVWMYTRCRLQDAGTSPTTMVLAASHSCSSGLPENRTPTEVK